VATGTGLTGGPISATGTISIAAGGVGTTELAANAVNAGKIADATVTGSDLAAATITGSNIAATTITGANIAATTMPDANIANTTITAGKLAQSGAATNDVLKWNGTTWAPALDASGKDATAQTGVLLGNGTTIAGSTAGPGVRGILGSTNNVIGWVNGAANQFLGTDGAGVLQFLDKSSLVFSTANEIPRGNGTALVSSNMFSTGTNIGIGTSTPRSVLEIQNGNLILSGSVSQPLDPVDIDFKTFDDVFKAKIWTDPASNTLWMSTSTAPASNKYFTLDENGNFGFSNTNPTAKVDIIGTFKLANGSQGVNKVLTSDAAGLSTWQAVGDRGNFNTAIGTAALAVNTGSINTAMGYNALPANTTGNRNSAFGYGALLVATTATDNVAVGYSALDATTTGSGNVGIGIRAGDTGTVGMENVSGNYNTFIGINAGPSTVTPINNSTAIGAFATVSQSNSLVLGGEYSNAVKVGIGTSSPDYTLQLFNNTKSTISLLSEGGLSDIIMGADADQLQGFIRYDNTNDRLQFGTSATLRGTFNIFGLGIGRVAAANALEVEGNASNTTASAWLANSDRRIKTDIRDIDNSFELIKRLRPVKFKYTEEWKRKHPSIKDQYYYNFIAQEYQQVFPESVKPSGEFVDGDPQEVLQVDTYNAQIAAIKAVQEMILKIEELEKENGKLKAESEQLKSESAKLKSEKSELESRLGSVEDKQQTMLKDLEALKQVLGTTSKE
jgi:hypothetical protein